MEPTVTDPYAPPKSTFTGTSNTTYLKEDGYAFQNELVANHHFKSPLICAKLGIHIPAESNPEAKEITVTRTSRFSISAISIFTLASFLLLIFGISYMDYFFAMPAIFIYILATRILRYLFSKPYQIPFYFSERYIRIRRRRVLILITVFSALLIFCVFGIITHNDQYTIIPIPLIFLALIIYKFKTTYFVVTQTKGEFHYIRGVHQNLLDELPHLPLSP